MERTVDRDFDGAASVYAADVDGDGDLDVLGAADNANDITWWENREGCLSRLVVRPREGDSPLLRTLLRHQIPTTVTTEIRYQLRDEVGVIVTEWFDGPVTFAPGHEYRFEGPMPGVDELAPGSYKLRFSLQGMNGFVHVTEEFEVRETPPGPTVDKREQP